MQARRSFNFKITRNRPGQQSGFRLTSSSDRAAGGWPDQWPWTRHTPGEYPNAHIRQVPVPVSTQLLP